MYLEPEMEVVLLNLNNTLLASSSDINEETGEAPISDEEI